jgi:2-methylcitrate dehydratase PrpD
VNEEGIDIADIKSIKLYVSQLAVGAAGKTAPKTGLEGKFSISYCVANALLRKDTGNKAFSDEKVNDPQIIALMDKISVEVKNEYKLVETIVEITTGSGKTYTRNADVMTNVPDLEAKKTKIKDKFVDLSTPVLGKERTEQLLEFITNLDEVDNVKTMIKCL